MIRENILGCMLMKSGYEVVVKLLEKYYGNEAQKLSYV